MDSSSYPEAPRDIGRVIGGRYRLTRRLGIGSSSEVYQADNLATGGTCAVKLLHREHLGISAARTRFAREVRLLARFDHPNIVRVHDAGDDPLGDASKPEHQPYFVMPVLRHHASGPRGRRSPRRCRRWCFARSPSAARTASRTRRAS